MLERLLRRVGGTGGVPAVSWSPTQVANAVRILVLALCLGLSVLSADRGRALTWFPLLVVAGAVAGARDWPPTAGRLLRLGEGLVCVVAVLLTGDASSPLFPYLLCPAFAGGLALGVTGAVVAPGFAALALIVAAIVDDEPIGNFDSAIAQWVVLALITGFVGAWIRRLMTPVAAPEVTDQSYAAAYRLLAQLRPVARQLSVGLDPVTIAEGLLESLRTELACERGAVFVRTGTGRLVPLAYLGASRVDWDVDVTGDGPFAEAWVSQQPQRLSHQFSGAPGTALVLPLVIGLRTFGVVGLETAHRALGPGAAADGDRLVAEAALRLETALLFDEVRGVATAEERRRLAREIHDGIAQELSYLGYFVDGLAATAGDEAPTVVADLQSLRNEITRIVGELRMSIFDLRSEVDTHGGLGAALSEYVRSVGRQAGLTVHLSLSEAAERLPAETEAELLRIAQEAVTNARKHAEAENLWVTLEVDPPSAVLRVEDDGRGLGKARADSYGLQIMKERAHRLRTEVQVSSREPRGTKVEVVLRAPAAPRTTLPGLREQVYEEVEGTSRR